MGTVDIFSGSLRCCDACIQYLSVTSEADVLQFLTSKVNKKPKQNVNTISSESDDESSEENGRSLSRDDALELSEQEPSEASSRRSSASNGVPDNESDNSSGPSNGRMHVTVVEASNLNIPAECTGIYCIVSLGKQQVRTSTYKLSGMSRSASWNEGFFFDVTRSDTEAEVSVWAEYLLTGTAGSFLGEIRLSLASIRKLATVPSASPASSSSSASTPASSSSLSALAASTASGLSSSPSVDKDMKLRSRTNQAKRGSLRIRITYQAADSKVTRDDFQLMRVVGRGHFGKVMMVRKRDTGRIYAMKVLHKETVIENDAIQHTLSESNVLRNVRHPFIVSLKYSFQTQDKLYLVMDYLCGGELFTHLSSVDHFDEWRTKFYAAQIVLALGYLHDMNVIYRDLKPENLLLDMDGYLCLTDFGLVKENVGWSEKTTTFCGSPEYLAPEILLGKPYGKGVDWWALGTFIYEMLSGWPPFFDEDHKRMNRRILHEPLSFDPQLFSREAKTLLRGLLERNQEKRLGSGRDGTKDIMQHPFFKDINWELLKKRGIEPPYKPHLQHVTDTRFFSDEFTAESVKDTYNDTQLSKTIQDAFKGFSWVAPTELELASSVVQPSRLSRSYRRRGNPSTPSGVSPQPEEGSSLEDGEQEGVPTKFKSQHATLPEEGAEDSEQLSEAFTLI